MAAAGAVVFWWERDGGGWMLSWLAKCRICMYIHTVVPRTRLKSGKCQTLFSGWVLGVVQYILLKYLFILLCLSSMEIIGILTNIFYTRRKHPRGLSFSCKVPVYFVIVMLRPSPIMFIYESYQVRPQDKIPPGSVALLVSGPLPMRAATYIIWVRVGL